MMVYGNSDQMLHAGGVVIEMDKGHVHPPLAVEVPLRMLMDALSLTSSVNTISLTAEAPAHEYSKDPFSQGISWIRICLVAYPTLAPKGSWFLVLRVGIRISR
jgi:hypothetical protein